MIYNLHIFHGNGNCIFSLNHDEHQENTTQMLYGFLWSLKVRYLSSSPHDSNDYLTFTHKQSFSNRISPVMVKDNMFFTYHTSTYQLIFMEMPTSLKFVLIVDPNPGKSNEYYKQCLRDLYRSVYVENVVRNPILNTTGQSIDYVLFRERLSDFVNKI